MNPTKSTGPPIDPTVGSLRIAGGVRLEDAAPCAATLTPPPQAARGREGERLFLLLHLTGPVSSHLYRELREVVAQAYWATAGSVTAALRRAAAAANRHLFRANLHAAPSDRCSGGLACAVLRGDDLFVLRAGPAHACFLHGKRVECFSGDEELHPLGIGQLADVRLHHVFIAPDDELLLASPALIQAAGDAGLARVLPRTGVREVLDGLEQVGAGADFTALIVRWPLPGEAPEARAAIPPLSRLKSGLPPPARREPPREETAKGREAPRLFPRPQPERRSDPVLSRSKLARSGSPAPDRERGVGTSLGAIFGPLSLGARLKSARRGVAAAGAGLAGGASTLFRRMLPGPGRGTRRRARATRTRPPRPVPDENRTVMMAIAIGIPIVLAIAVALAYLSFGAQARFQGIIDQAEREIALAQAAGGDLEASRPHWEAALEHADTAVALQPDDQVATSLQAQAQAALDSLDGVIRLRAVRLGDLGMGTVPRQLVVHGQMIFVLDPAGGWVTQLTLNQAGDGVIEQGDAPILVQTGQQIGGGTVGRLVDFVWVGPTGGRQASGLLILEEDGALLSYDPAWTGEGGMPQLERFYLGVPPASPGAVGTYDGRFYVMDAGVGQIRRYEPRGNAYPDRPDNYFVAPPPRPLTDARDMAIDGYIYILFDDGAILKFLRGEPETFDVRGLPGDLTQAVALAVDPDGNSGAVYVADQGNERVVVLGPDGNFLAQFRADEAFDALESLAVDEAAGRLYVVGGGRLYVASLP